MIKHLSEKFDFLRSQFGAITTFNWDANSGIMIALEFFHINEVDNFLNFIVTYKDMVEEKELRDKNETLNAAYKEYQTLLKLIKDK